MFCCLLLRRTLELLFMGHDPTRGSRQEVFKISRVRSGSGREVPRSSRVESGRVKSFSKLAGRLKLGQEVHKITRVRSGQVEADQNFAGRVGSTVFQNSRVGSCRVKRFSKSRGSGRVGWGRQVTRPDPIRLVRYDLTHEKPGVYRYSCSVFRIIFNCH